MSNTKICMRSLFSLIREACSGTFAKNEDPKGKHVLDRCDMEVPSPLQGKDDVMKL